MDNVEMSSCTPYSSYGTGERSFYVSHNRMGRDHVLVPTRDCARSLELCVSARNDSY